MEKPKVRDHYWDNVKFILITLVVVGHFCEMFFDHSDLLLVTWEFIFVFHMPAFILVSGIFLAKTINRPKLKVERILGYLIMYFFITVSLNVLCQFGFGWSRSWELFTAKGPQWYMLAIAIYIGFTYIIRDFNPKIVIIASFFLALFVGYDDSVRAFFAISRVIVAYPYFYLGYWIGREQIKEKIKTLKDRKVFYVLSAAWFVMLFALISKYLTYWLKISALCTMSHPYADLSIPLMFGGFARAAFYVLTMISIIALLVLVPERKMLLTPVGSRTMQIYVIHGYIIRYSFFISLDAVLAAYIGDLWPVAIIVIGVLCTIVLSAKVLEKPFRAVIDLDLPWLYKKE